MGLFSPKSTGRKLSDKLKAASGRLAKRGKQWAGPKVEGVQKVVENQLVPAVKSTVDDVKDAVSDLPATPANAKAVKKAAKKAAKSARKEVKKMSTKSTKKRKGLIFLVVSAIGAAVGYALWKRSQPLEDPWAEEYWEDIDFEDLSNKAEETAKEAKDAATEKASDVAEQVAEAIDKAKEQVEKK